MRYRKLRIAWSLAWGVLAVLMIVLWARSYFGGDYLYWNYAYHRSVVAGSTHGHMIVYGDAFTIGSSRMSLKRTREMAFYLTIRWTVAEPLIRTSSLIPIRTAGFGRSPASMGHAVSVSHWLPTLAFSALASIPWISSMRWRFSLRTLLIVTTLVAVVLGLVVYATRSS